MEKQIGYSEQDIENSKVDSHRYLNYVCAVSFLVWGFGDFYQRELFAPIFILFRVLIFTIMLLFVSPLNTKFFQKHHNILTSIFLSTVVCCSVAFTLFSSNSYDSNIIFVGAICIAAALLYQGSYKYFLPIVLAPLATLLLLQNFILNEEANFNLLLGKGIFLLCITFLSHYNLNRFAQKTYKLRTKFEKQKQETEQLLNENNQLVRILCHDLGNALTVIDMTTDLMEKNFKPSEEQKDYYNKSIQRLKRATTTQKEIIEHVKQKEALDSGKKSIKTGPVNLNIVFEKMRFIFQSQIDEKNLSFNISYSFDKSPYVLAELVSLSNNVINNIVSNAIKFTPDNGEIKISTWSDKQFVYVMIEDNGVGMNDELRLNIFSPNIKTSRPGTRGEKGTGFGMPLAKTYMNKYGGEIFIDSQVGKGTRFTLKFLNIEQSIKEENKNIAG